MSMLAMVLMAVAAPVATQPDLLNKMDIFAQENYPFWARDSSEEGTVRVSVEVSEVGAVTSCRVTRSSGSAALDVGTCDLITARGRYAPARNENGKAVAGLHVMSVTWRLEQDGPWEVEDSRSLITYSVGPNRLVSDCRVEEQPVDPDFDPRTCDEYKRDVQMMVAGSPPEFAWNDWNVVIETSNLAGAGDAAMMVGKRNGEMLFEREITRMTIDPHGRIARCEPVESADKVADAVWCERMMRTTVYESASDKTARVLMTVWAMYLRKKK